MAVDVLKRIDAHRPRDEDRQSFGG